MCHPFIELSEIIFYNFLFSINPILFIFQFNIKHDLLINRLISVHIFIYFLNKIMLFALKSHTLTIFIQVQFHNSREFIWFASRAYARTPYCVRADSFFVVGWYFGLKFTLPNNLAYISCILIQLVFLYLKICQKVRQNLLQIILMNKKKGMRPCIKSIGDF